MEEEEEERKGGGGGGEAVEKRGGKGKIGEREGGGGGGVEAVEEEGDRRRRRRRGRRGGCTCEKSTTRGRELPVTKAVTVSSLTAPSSSARPSSKFLKIVTLGEVVRWNGGGERRR